MTEQNGKIKIVIADTNMLLSGNLTNLLLDMAQHDIIDVQWSRYILEEARHRYTKRYSGSTAKDATQFIDALKTYFPDSTKSVTQADRDMVRRTRTRWPDPNDFEVIVTAFAAKADILLTKDTGGFPLDTMRQLNIQVMHPNHLIPELIRSNPETIKKILSQTFTKNKSKRNEHPIIYLATLVRDDHNFIVDEIAKIFNLPIPSAELSQALSRSHKEDQLRLQCKPDTASQIISNLEQQRLLLQEEILSLRTQLEPQNLIKANRDYYWLNFSSRRNFKVFLNEFGRIDVGTQLFYRTPNPPGEPVPLLPKARIRTVSSLPKPTPPKPNIRTVPKSNPVPKPDPNPDSTTQYGPWS